MFIKDEQMQKKKDFKLTNSDVGIDNIIQVATSLNPISQVGISF
jgi:hypothetical protein